MTKIIKKHKFPFVITLAILVAVAGVVFYFSGTQKARGAVQTLLLNNDLSFSIPPLQSFSFDETNATPSTDTTTDINTGNTNTGRYFIITPGQINSTPFGTAQPTNITTAGFRSSTLLKGGYSNGNWTFKVKLRNRAAYAHSGKVYVRLWKAVNADMTSPTAVTDWFASPNTINFSATSGEIKTDVFTYNPGGPNLNNEWFYVEYVWYISAKANNSAAGFQFVVDESSGEEAVLTTSWTSTVNPDATSYTNDTNPAMNNLGGKIGDQITITGNSFRNNVCTGSDYKISIQTFDIPCGNVISWQNTSIVFTIPATINVYGGVGALMVFAAGTSDPTPLDFYVYPTAGALQSPPGVPCANCAREYSAGDTDGVITLTGTAFGLGGTVTILNQPATVNSYTDTAIEVRVPTSIADNLYQGSITLTRTNPPDNRTATWSTFRILPRITGITPSSGVANDPVTISGNHLCQPSGTCPGVGSRSTASDNVVFATVQVSDANVTGWTNTAINANVPTGTPVGNITVTVESFNDLSNAFPFVILTSIPNDPSSATLYQFKTDTDTAQPPTTNIAVNGGINQTNVWFRMTMSAVVNATLIPQVEVKAVGVAFDGIGIIDGAGVAYSGTPVLGWVQATGLADGTSYHWRVRVKNQTTSDVSGWVSFGGNADPGDTDFYIDTTFPIISAVNATNIAGNTATIEWTTNESATQQVEYGISTCDPGAYFEPSSGAGSGTSHSITLLGLSSNTTYYYRVRSKDLANNETISPSAPSCNSFLTVAPEVKAMKTLEFFAKQQTTTITAPYTDPGTTFQIYISDASPNIQNAFVEVSGVSSAGAGIEAKVNSAASMTANLSANNVTAFNLMYNIPNPNTTLLVASENNPSPTNTLYMNLTGTSNISLLSAKVVVTYYYSP